MNTRIADIRKQAGFSTQEQLAECVGIPRAVIAKWEAGITTPRYKTLLKLASKLNTTVDDLLRATADEDDEPDGRRAQEGTA